MILKSEVAPAALAGASYQLKDFEAQKQAYFAEIQKQAAGILAEARAQERKILDQARAEGLKQADAEVARRSALAEKAGREEGLKKGREEALKAEQERVKRELDPLAEALRKSMAGFEERRAATLKAAEERLVSTALSLARKIIQVEAEANPAVLQAQLARALDLLVTATNLEIRLNPADMEKAQAALPALFARRGESPAVVLKLDPSVGRGGCVVASGDGQVDGRLEEQWKQLLAAAGRPEPA